MREPETSFVPRAASRVVAAVIAAGCLAGCAAIHDRFEAVRRPSPSRVTADDGPVDPSGLAVKTVGRGGVRPAPAPQARVAEASAVPTPREIFDFHPAGLGSDGWRQPFLIDRDDGPLTRDVARSEAELRDYKADLAARGSVAGRKLCSETDVAHAEPNCSPARPRAAAARDPLALQ